MHLVTINSETKKEENIALYLKRKMKSLGLHVVEDEAKRITGLGANNLICTLEGNMPGAKTIFFASHMDTVKPGENIQPKIAEEYIVSDGTTILGADDKAGIAAMIELIHILQEYEIGHGNIQFVFTVGEEAGLLGAKAIDRSLIKAQLGYVLDASGEVGNFIVRSPYYIQFTIEINRHSDEDNPPSNTAHSLITIARTVISQLQLGKVDRNTYIKITYFNGGEKQGNDHSIQYVKIKGEIRSYLKSRLDKVLTQMKEKLKFVTKKERVNFEFTNEEIYPGYSLSKHIPGIQATLEAAKNLRLPSNGLESNYVSDANIFNDFNIETVNLSVGYEHIHSTKERIKKNNLITLTKFIYEIVQVIYK